MLRSEDDVVHGPMRKKWSFPNGAANGSNRPFVALEVQPNEWAESARKQSSAERVGCSTTGRCPAGGLLEHRLGAWLRGQSLMVRLPEVRFRSLHTAARGVAVQLHRLTCRSSPEGVVGRRMAGVANCSPVKQELFPTNQSDLNHDKTRD
jgi:hypothetical protein